MPKIREILQSNKAKQSKKCEQMEVPPPALMTSRAIPLVQLDIRPRRAGMYRFPLLLLRGKCVRLFDFRSKQMDGVTVMMMMLRTSLQLLISKNTVSPHDLPF